jgi:hypothetical protein
MAGLQKLQKLSRSVLRADGSEQSSRMEHVRTAVVRLPDKAAYVAELSRLWRESCERFLAIGEYLLLAKEALPHGEYEQMVASELPFGRSVTHALKTVAEAVRAGRLAKAELPLSYATAYLLASMSPPHLDLARQRGLVRPNVTRAAITSFRTELRQETRSNPRAELLQKERLRLLREIELMQQRVAEIDAEVGREGFVIEGDAAEEPQAT